MSEPSHSSAAALAAFREWVLAEPAQLAELEPACELDTFLEKAVALGAVGGWTFSADDVRSAVRQARRAWVERNLPGSHAEAMLDAGSGLAGWTPLRVFATESGPRVDWCRFGSERFTEPFFEQTIQRVLRHPARMLFRRQTSLDALEAFGCEGPGLRPSGFIFHLSRCGSTLAAQLLAALPRSVVISEAPPIDHILAMRRRDPRIGRAQRLAWFRGMVNALGQRRRAEDRDYFIKFDSWHVLELPFILEAFPDVPWIFLYRDPVEVLVSQHRQRGMQMIPGMVDPRTFGFEPPEIAGMSFDEYGARVLARICAAASVCSRLGRGRLVNFAQLPAALTGTPEPGRACVTGAGVLLDFFGIECTPDERERMRRAAHFNAKTPSLPHADDRVAKQGEATAELRRLADRWLGDIYATLEAQRSAQESLGAVMPDNPAAEISMFA